MVKAVCKGKTFTLNTGFTLIELLVVIAVIALLLAVILPALNSAKLLARQVVCAAQMKQWALATSAYASENDSAIPPYADTCDLTNGGNALDSTTYWYNRLSAYLTREGYGTWGMTYEVRRCPMARANWGEKAVWVGVYYGEHRPERAPFIYLNSWNGSTLTKKCGPFKLSKVSISAQYMAMLDVQRDDLFEPVRWNWNVDFDGDGMNDSNGGVIGAGLSPYNHARPKIHRGGCNVALFDGHVEWIRYNVLWEYADGYPVHRYWYNQNRP
ncbi:MAG: type II secretion system GspH family protein [Planctomycetaceae bacterium]|nr:type II secretion system GspH family protein [Planctomycetaceae bacterium]